LREEAGLRGLGRPFVVVVVVVDHLLIQVLRDRPMLYKSRSLLLHVLVLSRLQEDPVHSILEAGLAA
jgi:hypothetical protein